MGISTKDPTCTKRRNGQSFVFPVLVLAVFCAAFLADAESPTAAFAQTVTSGLQSANPSGSGDNAVGNSTPDSAQIMTAPIPCSSDSPVTTPTIPGFAQLQSIPATSCANNGQPVPGQSDQSLLPSGFSPPTMPASLMAQPQYGMSPLMVDFFVIQGSPQTDSSTTYQWSFGDGTVSSLPPQAFIAHVYSHPGTYFCSVIMMSPQGQATTLLASVIVRPHKS